MFDFLTLSVVIDDAIFCVHGGLSPSIHHIDQIKIIDRFREVPHEGPMADLVWSDPDPEKEDFAISPRYVRKPERPGDRRSIGRSVDWKLVSIRIGQMTDINVEEPGIRSELRSSRNS